MILSPANINKTILYCKRNGLRATALAALERIEQKKGQKYSYAEPSEDELKRQGEYNFEYSPLISILVPCYETKPVFIEDLVLSLEDQTYKNFNLVMVDASNTNHVERMVKELSAEYDNITYVRLEKNGGISENTNAGLEYCTGEYIGLLDHDDLLTKDCLFRMVEAVNASKNSKGFPILAYSDEDKTDTYLEKYYEPNRKMPLDAEMILTNNYICHFSLFKSEVIKELRLRKEYDGAQDYDLVLRTIRYAREKYADNWRERIIHVPYILYHWRCHEQSTASNPLSKNYAYENGRLAVENYLQSAGVKAKVCETEHVGFYRVCYENIFDECGDVAAVGGPIYTSGRISGGKMNAKGKVVYEGLRKGYSGYMNRAVLLQEAACVDIRNISVSKKYTDMFEKETGYRYPLTQENIKKMTDEEAIQKSLRFCNKIRALGIRILYNPQSTNERKEDES